MEQKEKENWRKTRFTSRIRIDPKELRWLQENMETKSAAAFLDIIIKKYKNGEILK